MNAADEATEQCVLTLPGAIVPQVASEWLLLYVSLVTIQTVWTNLKQFVGTWKTLQNHRTGKIWGWALRGNGCLLGGNTIQVVV